MEVPNEELPPKINVCHLNASSTRYSLVKGERIVRFVLNAWLREGTVTPGRSYKAKQPTSGFVSHTDMGFSFLSQCVYSQPCTLI